MEHVKGSGVSLKAFHVLFVIVSGLLGLGFGAWAIRDYRAGGGTDSLVAGVLSLVGVMALLVYGQWFLRKLKGVSYL